MDSVYNFGFRKTKPTEKWQIIDCLETNEKILNNEKNIKIHCSYFFKKRILRVEYFIYLFTVL